MNYSTTVTSKGTITIAAPLRKMLGISTGQTLHMSRNEHNQIVIDPGTNLKSFQAMRSKISAKVPDHLKGLSGESLRGAASTAWTTDYND